MYKKVLKEKLKKFSYRPIEEYYFEDYMSMRDCFFAIKPFHNLAEDVIVFIKKYEKELRRYGGPLKLIEYRDFTWLDFVNYAKGMQRGICFFYDIKRLRLVCEKYVLDLLRYPNFYFWEFLPYDLYVKHIKKEDIYDLLTRKGYYDPHGPETVESEFIKRDPYGYMFSEYGVVWAQDFGLTNNSLKDKGLLAKNSANKLTLDQIMSWVFNFDSYKVIYKMIVGFYLK